MFRFWRKWLSESRLTVQIVKISDLKKIGEKLSRFDLCRSKTVFTSNLPTTYKSSIIIVNILLSLKDQPRTAKSSGANVIVPMKRILITTIAEYGMPSSNKDILQTLSTIKSVLHNLKLPSRAFRLSTTPLVTTYQRAPYYKHNFKKSFKILQAYSHTKDNLKDHPSPSLNNQLTLKIC